MDQSKRTISIAIIGAGPAGLMAAETLAGAGLVASIYDRMPSAGRKFLMAGRGGLNLTHSEPLERFLSRYGAAESRLRAAIEAFPPAALRDWAESLGQPTFVGSSGRVFPRAFKASPLLRAWLARLREQGASFHARHDWLGWTEPGGLLFRRSAGSTQAVAADIAILALGGASWPRLGGDGGWAGILSARDVKVTSLRPANCGFRVVWSDRFRARFEGQPLKNLSLSFAGTVIRGEAMITARGIEGGAIYALSAPLRDAIAESGPATLRIDLAPGRSAVELARKLATPPRGLSTSTFLRRTLNLPPIAIGLLHEAEGASLPERPETLAALIKAVPLALTEPAPLERAISTAGGIDWAELDQGFMLKRLPGVFAAGEMLDWEAPTGGYLLQACFATGAAAARGALAWLDR